MSKKPSLSDMSVLDQGKGLIMLMSGWTWWRQCRRRRGQSGSLWRRVRRREAWLPEGNSASTNKRCLKLSSTCLEIYQSSVLVL